MKSVNFSLLANVSKLWTEIIIHPWDSWEKPWSREQCEERFVMGSHVSIRKMAAESGRSKSSIERWAKADNWEDKRSQFSSSLRTEIREKTIQKASDKLSEDYATIAISNYKAHKIERDMAHATLQIYAKAIAQIQNLPLEDQLKRLKELSGYEINYWSLVLGRATQGVNAATGLSNYVQLDSAAKVLISKGYEIVDPNDTEATRDNTE